tara:strand:- start:1977 stop:2273 length:297 start_codon:yes stop_codon:yes gene_type:complete
MLSKDKKQKMKRNKTVEYKTKEERKEQVINIIKELSKFELNLKYEPVKKLYRLFKIYIDEGKAIKVNIPFEMINRRFSGHLKIGKREDCQINLKPEKF